MVRYNVFFIKKLNKALKSYSKIFDKVENKLIVRDTGRAVMVHMAQVKHVGKIDVNCPVTVDTIDVRKGRNTQVYELWLLSNNCREQVYFKWHHGPNSNDLKL